MWGKCVGVWGEVKRDVGDVKKWGSVGDVKKYDSHSRHMRLRYLTEILSS